MRQHPGRLDQRVTFRAKVRAADTMGGAAESWVDVASNATVWAHVRPLTRATENVGSERVEALGRYLVTVRNRSDLDEGMQMVWRGEAYNIRRIERAGVRPLYLTLEAERGAAT